jgi:hypothetical protein
MPRPVEEDALREEARKSLERIQQFDTSKLPQTERLGADLTFQSAVEPADRLVRLYNQISLTVLSDLPTTNLEQLKNKANEDFNRFSGISGFQSNQGSPQSARDSLVQELVNAYQPAFSTLHPLISYSASKSTDFKRLESEARAAVQAIQDRVGELMQQLQDDKTSAAQVLDEIRKVAAEQGVSQQAVHFATEATSHSSDSLWWLKVTAGTAGCLLVWAFLCLFLSKWEFLKPSNAYESVQLVVSKTMIFGVLSFAVYLSAKNFLTHKHNAIVNKHRQNALVTYRALVEAAGEKANGDIVLTQAAACIFSPQPTGYSSSKPFDGATAKSVVELFGHPMASGE